MLHRSRVFARSSVIMAVVALALGGELALAGGASAATARFVATTGSDTSPTNNPCTNPATPCRTISRALTVSVAGDTINVAAGTYVGALSVTKAVSIVGAGPASSTIDGNQTAAAIVTAVAPTATVTISGFTVQNGKSNFGGGIEILEGGVVLNNDVITHNTATTTSNAVVGGGGIGLDGSQFGGASLDATNVTITANTSTAAGGGAFLAAPATFHDVTVSNNTAGTSGGGVNIARVLTADTPRLSTADTNGTSITGNTAGSAGGGVAVLAASTLALTSLDSVGNNTAVNGGGIYVAENATATLDGASVSGNTANGGATAAGGNGGGVFNSGTLTITHHATFTGNKAVASTNTTNALRGFGGAIVNDSPFGLTPVLTISDSTITGGLPAGAFNATEGGALAQFSPTAATLTNTTLTGNTAFLGGGVYAGTGVTLTGSQLSANIAVEGGAAYVPVPAVSGQALSVSGGSMSGNSAALGGAVFIVGKGSGSRPGSATLSGVSVTGNVALGGTSATAGDGGAVFDSGQLTISNSSTLSGNYVVPSTASGAVTGIGGAVYVGPLAAGDTASATISDSTVSGGTLPNGVNANAVLGGGVAVLANAFGVSGSPAAGTLTATNDTVTGNIASRSGGGLYEEGSATVSGGTIGSNRAPFGGGVYVLEDATAGLTGVTVSGNTATSATGGNGGGAYNAGNLNVVNSVLSGNRAVAGSGSGTGGGGAIFSGSNASAPHTVRLTLTGDTLSGNTAGSASAVLAVNGGAAGSDNRTTITDSTITGNSATSSTGAGSVAAFHPMSIVASTIDANTSAFGSGGIYGTATTVSGTILSANSGGDCGVSGPFVRPVDGGYNLTDAGDASCGFTSATDVAGNPQLGALGPNGGPTPTQMPGPSSPAINAIPVGTPNLCVAGLTDQRGVARPQGAQCDIGAVEVDLTAPTLAGPTTPTFTTGQAGTFTYKTTGVPTPHLSESGTLPAGVTFVDNGDGTATLAGTPQPNTGGAYPITVTATNGTAPDATLSVTVTVQQPPTLSGPASADYVVNRAGTPVTFTTTGFPTPHLTETGALPPGMQFVDNGDGTASVIGTPTTAGQYSITVTASNGVAPDATRSFTLNVAPPVSVVTTSLPSGQVGVTYSATLTATGGAPPYTWSLASGALPAGLTLAPDGTINGTPTGPVGTATFTVQASDSLNPADTATQQLAITINRGPTTLSVSPVILQTSLLRVTFGIVEAKLTGGDPAVPLSGQTIVFTAGTTVVCTATTNADGVARCTMTVLNTVTVIAHGGVTANYAGSALWLPSSGQAGLLGSS
jgi:hypothetical protein